MKKTVRRIAASIAVLGFACRIFADDGARGPEHPRPDFQRSTWQSLDGQWDFAFDDNDSGLQQRWFASHTWPMKIRVPFPHQAKLSGIGQTEHHRVVWYHRQFTRPKSFPKAGHVRLHFGAVDFEATVWVNGSKVGEYRSGVTPFACDIESFLRPGENDLVVRVFDDPLDPAQTTGKQHPSGKLTRWHYTHITGIWQSVWLEAVPLSSISGFVVRTPAVADPMPVQFEIRTDCASLRKPRLRVTLTHAGGQAESITTNANASTVLTLRVRQPKLWSPEAPNLYDIQIELLDGRRRVDEVRSYTGLRTLSWGSGKYLLNEKPLWLNGALDQGYWPEGILTHPNDEALRRDVEFAKSVGLNMVRMHQKVADPRYLYWCDRLGLMVWGEMANAGEGHFSKREADIADQAWNEVIRRDRNHPCIIAWVYSNESWMHQNRDDAEREHYLAAFNRMRAMDGTRPVIDTSGWFHLQTDIFDFHGVPNAKRLETWIAGNLREPPFRPEICYFEKTPADFGWHGWPLVVSEWVAVGDFAKADEVFYRKYEAAIMPLAKSRTVCGQVYVQLYDIENERNGYMTYDRQWKIAPERVRAIHEQFTKTYQQGMNR